MKETGEKGTGAGVEETREETGAVEMGWVMIGAGETVEEGITTVKAEVTPTVGDADA